MKSLKPRLLTAAIGIPLLILIIFVSMFWRPIISVVVGLASAFMVGELLHAKNLLKCYLLSVLCMLFSCALSVLITTEYAFIALTLFMTLAFAVIIFKHEELSFSDLAFALSGTLLISFGMSSISMACSNEICSMFYFVAVFLLPWMSDAGGFFVGATLGKHKLCPKISPKKTVEGALGGILFCLISAVGMGAAFKLFLITDVNINFAALILLGVIVAPLSILGDLSFSLIKRSLDIKDYGSIFPGHGGMLDRFDSIIFTAPFVVIVNYFIPFLNLG